jgi:hypothetical protein
MKIGEIAKLLAGIGSGLEDLSKTTASGLHRLRAAMQPFNELTVDQFEEFLRQCQEYKTTGVVMTGRRPAASKTKPPAISVTEAASRVRGLLDEINQGAVTSSRIDALIATLKKDFKKPDLEHLLVALQIAGKPKTKDQAVDRIKQTLNSQLEMYVKAQPFRMHS